MNGQGFDRPGFEYEYLLAKLTEVQEALAFIDASEDPLAYAETRSALEALASQLVRALGTFGAPADAHETALN